ncbi:PepSY domain-containing protein [Leptothoe spongobia]|uniref:PepSY domain-containing protein n=1 Tax=Leptothoe spongobia TAU-MAC 1115 TaxID=1967444 RepID=A0A947DKB7_9CYAN|nr:PepSY domain-containing protein [Leptothoe spongobia]MBT9317775.1 PepSY domain-containing protein [Leptothoe spongobia TAU-MAC 1115]
MSSTSFTKRIARWNRLYHRWIAIAIAIPMIFIITTGIFLQIRKPIDWIQPPTTKGSQKYQPTASLEQILTQVKSVPAMQVTGWEDIKLLDLRPNKGIIKVRNHDQLETQVDAATAEVLQTAQRRNDFVVKMHDFSAWHARLWLGLPVRVGFLVLFLTGVYLNIKMTPVRLKTLFQKSSKRTTQTAQTATTNVTTHIPQATAKDGRPLRLRLKSWLLTYHYWLGWVVMIPWACVIFSGLLLQVRYEVPWVMPVLQQGQGTVPKIEFPQVLETAQQLPEYGVEEWKDVWRVYVYPNQGVTTIRAENRQEFQIDSSTGDVLQVATRRTDWLEDIHEGKWHDLNLWLFLPIHILSLFLWLTGTAVAYNR